MNLREALRDAMGMLTGAGVPSSATAAEVLLLHVLGRDRAYLYARPDEELPTDLQFAYQELLERRASGIPTQYLTGRQEFWGLEFHVEPGVLIPRPETEHVVEVTLRIVRERLQKTAPRIVDVGTGSGCIALALATELPQAEISAVDISEDALRVARLNAARLSLSGRVKFLQSDLLDVFLNRRGERPREDFDLVVCNPPYVSRKEEQALPREVREHEPSVALFSPEDGLGITRRLLEQSRQLLRPDSWIVLELGYNQAGRMHSLLDKTWVVPEISNDLRGIPRVLAAQKA